MTWLIYLAAAPSVALSALLCAALLWWDGGER